MPDLNALKARADENGVITGEVVVYLPELIEYDHEALLDYISDRLTGTSILTDISYHALRVNEYGQIVLGAEGNIADIVNEFQDTPYDTST